MELIVLMNGILNHLSISNPITIGIVGGGQLGKMLAQEAKRMALKVAILDPSKDCPASTLCNKLVIGDFKDEAKIYELARESDIVTYEIELANSTALRNLDLKKYPIYPSPYTLKIIQNKFRQKTFLLKNKIAVTDFCKIESKEDFLLAIKKFGFPLIIKASEDSYDGRGNFLVSSETQIDKAYSYFNNKEKFAEKFVDFTKEISILVARNKSGQTVSFPVAENLHRYNILDTTIVPARISDQAKINARKIAEKVASSIKDVGIFGIEMFVTKNDDILINEIAPRPHNSGHYTIEGCSVSQFEQHIRSILNLPLAVPELLRPVVMKNILGPDGLCGNYKIRGLKNLFSIPGVKIHIYGKKITKPKRKLGHIIATGSSITEALERANKSKNSIDIIID